MFKVAGKPEIIRSHQKDQFYLSYLRGLAADVIHTVFGPRFWIAWRKELDIVADLGYFCLTTLTGFQTLGEEYVNIVQVDHTQRKVPTDLNRCLMVLLHVLAPYGLRKFFDWLDKKLRSHDVQEIPIETREFLLRAIPVAKTVVLYSHRLHMAAFYLHGIFYHIAKRFNGIHYIQYTGGAPQRVDESVNSSFKVLGWITFTQLVGSALLGVYRYRKEKSKQKQSLLEDEKTSDSVSGFVAADRKCSLCLEERKQSSVTPCGHLFCWTCIHDWCSNKAECPLCREQFEQNRIVYLQNFDPS